MRNFLTGLATGASGAISSRQKEERDMANMMSQLFLKAKMEKMMEDPMERELKRRKNIADAALAEAEADYYKQELGVGTPQASGTKMNDPNGVKTTVGDIVQNKTDIWQGIPEDERSMYFEPEPIYKKVGKINVTSGYKPPTLKPQYENFYKNKEDNERLAGSIKGKAQDALSTISEIRKGMDYFGTFGNLPSIPGTARKNWEVNVNKIMSELVLGVMNDMKQASRTGATGFGQLSNKELMVLQNAATALKKDLKKEDADKYLSQIENKFSKVLGGKNNVVEDMAGRKGKIAKPQNVPPQIWDAATEEQKMEFMQALGAI